MGEIPFPNFVADSDVEFVCHGEIPLTKDAPEITGKSQRFDPPFHPADFSAAMVSDGRAEGMEKIIDTYACYHNDDFDLAVSLTARSLGIDESVVRDVLEA